MQPVLGLTGAITKEVCDQDSDLSDELRIFLIKVTNNEVKAYLMAELAPYRYILNSWRRKIVWKWPRPPSPMHKKGVSTSTTSRLHSQEIRVTFYPSPRPLLNHTSLCILGVWMNSHTSDSRPSSSAGRISSRGKSHSSPPRPESKLSSQKHSSPRNSLPGSGIRRPYSTGTETIRSDGSWMPPEVLAWKRPQRLPRVARSPVAPVTPKCQANHCNTFDTVHEEPAPQDQRRSGLRKGSGASTSGAGTHGLPKRPDAPRDKLHQDVNQKVMERRARPEVSHVVHHQHSAPGALGVDRNVLRQQHQGSSPRREKLVSLSKDFQNQLVNPMPNAHLLPSEEGMPSFASKKVAHWLKPPRNKTERPHSASLAQALRFTALLAQAPLADAGLDEKTIPSRYNPQNRTAQGSRFAGC
ncbi:hypothetical protein ACGC1H_000996 [Rhizoctonia solani]